MTKNPVLRTRTKGYSSGVENSTSTLPFQFQEATPPNGAGSPLMRALTYLKWRTNKCPLLGRSSPCRFQRNPALSRAWHRMTKKVPIALGRETAPLSPQRDGLWTLFDGGITTGWGHWYSKEMLSDIVVVFARPVGAGTASEEKTDQWGVGSGGTSGNVFGKLRIGVFPEVYYLLR